MTTPLSQASDGEMSQSEQVRQLVGEEILTGRLEPGALLSESGLADRFGVSRTPVREAIRILAGDGLVQLRPGRRPVVRGKTVAEMIDHFEAMAEFEASCAFLAARRRNEPGLAEMTAAQAECRRFANEDDITRYYDANVVFHEAIYDMSGNSYLKAETLRLRDRLRFLRISQGRMPGRLAQSADEHDRILAAIRDGDQNTASAEMRNHVMVQGERLRVMLRTTDPGAAVQLAGLSDDANDSTPDNLRRNPGGP